MAGQRCQPWYSAGMRSTIDKAGRVVIPAAIRERAGLSPGSELEITEDELGVRLQRVAPGPKLVKVGRRLVARSSVSADRRPVINIEALIEEERNRWP
jgi:AbrB family looped-hinge helix DNA binding protein